MSHSFFELPCSQIDHMSYKTHIFQNIYFYCTKEASETKEEEKILVIAQTLIYTLGIKSNVFC